MTPEELDRELDGLWRRVAPPEGPPSAGFASPFPIVDDPSPAREAMVETIRLLKRQHREQAAQWEEMSALKDQMVRELAERLRAADAELAGLRRREAAVDDRLMAFASDMNAKLEAAGAALKEQEERFRREERTLREVAERARQQLLAETRRWRELEREWASREDGYQAQVKDLEARAAASREESGQRDEAARKTGADLKEAKGAVEATLGQLLKERGDREASDRESEKALKQVAELTEHLKNMQRIWEEERGQWAELWDRERSTWEGQRQEIAAWEERLRKEREAWHGELREKEARELTFAEALTRNLRESAEATARMGEVLKSAAGAASGVTGPRRRSSAAAWAMGALAVVVAAAAYPVWQRLKGVAFDLEASHAVALDNPTALAVDGSVLWVSDWSGRLLSLDAADPSRVLARVEPRALPTSALLAGRDADQAQAAAPSLRPVSIAAGGDAIWSVDASRGRIVKHSLSDPSRPQAAWPSPGPAPVAVAHDGRGLWSYDAVTRTIYRHKGEGGAAETEPFPLEADLVPTSMAWLGKDLWLHDSKGKRLWRFSLSEGALKPAGSTPFEPTALTVTGRRTRDPEGEKLTFWALCSAGARSGFSIKRLRAREVLALRAL